MKEIEVMRPSAKQLAKLRKGHPVRLQKGEGLILVVRPERFDLMSKTFARGKARTVDLSPEELMANMKIAPEAHQEQQAVEDNKAKQQFEPDKTVKLATPRSSSVPIGGTGLTPRSRTPVSNAGGPRGIPVRTLVGAKDIVKHLGKVGFETGQNFSGRMDAAIGSANANHMTAEMGRAGIESARSNHLVPYDIRGEGLYAGRSVMFGRGHREHASVAVGGNLLGGKRELPPALQSQPYAANFQFQFTLPPNFQRFSGGK
jgi:hypothetical protein